ncbi:MAG: RHS repeat-associated core domain-containing protein, partial [bacterium]|nr:RHS repeat-associated core domain-containing protein [bacterium]
VAVIAGGPVGSAEDVVLFATITPPQGSPTVMQFEMLAGEHGVFTVDFGQIPQEVIDHYTQELSAATDPLEQEAWTLALAGALYQRLLSGDLEHLAGLRWQRLVQLGTAVLAVQRGAVSTAPDGTPLVFSKGPMSLDLGAMPLGLFPASGAAGSTVPTMELLGSQGSFLEGEALSQVIGGEQITAVTFLTRAVREGQTLTLVDAGNVDAALAQAELSTDAEAHVRAGVGQGKIAWISESQLPVDTWQTSGYILEDPDTGAAGYFVTFERLVEGLEANIVFHSPQDLDVVTEPIDVVATIESEALDSWTLSYQFVGEGQPVVLATGTGSVSNATLAQFDPTLLLNGLYDIVLTGRDIAGQSVSGKISVSVEGNMKIGNFTLSFIDLAIPLSGLDIEIVRTYDSRQRELKGDFGYGWTLDIRQGSYQNNRPPGDGWQIVNPGGPFGLPCSAIIESKSHLTTVRLSDQEIYRFSLKLVDPAVLFGGCQARAVFEWVDGPLPGTTLEILGNDEVIYENESNRVLDDDSFQVFEPDNVKLTTRDGRIFHVTLETGVKHLEDLNGNAVDITANGIAHSSGVGIDFVRDSEDRIQEIVDTRGNSNIYTYDTAGDLIQHTNRAGTDTRFTYRDHYLEEIYNALGVRPIRNDYDEDGRLIRHTDAFGKTIDLSHDLDNRREVVTNRLGYSRVLEYDSRGNVVRETDEVDAVTERTFDGDDNLLTEKNPVGRTTTYTYDANNDLLTLTDALGQITTYTYNDRGQILTVTDPKGHLTTSTYAANGSLLSTTDALGQTTRFAYDTVGNRLSTTDALNQTTSFTYNSQGHQLTETDPLGNVTTFTNDVNGNRLTESRNRTLPNGSTETLVITFTYDTLDRVIRTTAPDGSTTSASYDGLGNVRSRTDAVGRNTTMTYGLMGRLTKTTFPDNTTQSQTYDAEGRVLAQTDRAGRETRLAYDAAGRLLTTTYPDGATQSQTYDLAGQLISTTDARGNTATYAYDNVGRRTSVTNALGQSTRFAYDANGNQSSITDARGNTIRFTYDKLDRLVTTIFPDGTTTQVSYDALDRRIRETDQAGITTQFGYDALGRLISVTDALGQVTAYTYDEVGNRLSQTDANGHTTRFEYNRLGRQIARILPDGARESMVYNLDGTLASHTDFAGKTRTFEYHANQRLVRRAYSDGSEDLFSYTATGQRETATDARGVTTYAYDDRDRLVEKQDPTGHRLTYAYDLQGNLTILTATIGVSSYTTSYGYDALNRLETITDPQGKVSTHTYDTNGNRASLEHANGMTTRYTYDALNRLTLLETRDSASSVVQSHAYTLAATGHRTRIAEANGTVRTYSYDDLYRLTRDRVTDSGGVLFYQRDFAYDPVGNRLSQTVDEGAGASVVSSTYDDRDRLLAADGASYGWDANGNLVYRDGGILDWDFEQRFTSVTFEDGTVVETLYDADGNRVQTNVTPPSGPVVSVDYLVDTRGFLSHVVAEVVTGAVRTVYIRSQDELISLYRPESGDARYFHADGLGSVRFLTDAVDAVTDSYEYTAFGGLIAHSGLDEQPYRFAGEPYDPNVRLYYNRARWLDPESGRFSNMDPKIGSLFEPASLHRYLYAAASPQHFVDPTGREFGVLGLQVSLGVRSYVTSVVASYSIGKVITAAYLYVTDHSLSRFRWFEWWDLLAFVPGAFLTRVVKLPVQMVTRVGGTVIGKAFAAGGLERVATSFSRWFASTNGKLFLRTANGAVVELEKGSAKRGFVHILRRHLTGFWDGSKPGVTTFFPSNVTPGGMLSLLREAASKYVASGSPAQSIVLSNGITAKLVVYGGKIITFFPESGPGVVFARTLVGAVP